MAVLVQIATCMYNYDTNSNEVNASALIKTVDIITNLPVGAIVLNFYYQDFEYLFFSKVK